MASMLDAALAYARKGWPIFPCRSDKTPYSLNGVLDATTDQATIRGWWDTWPRANIGLNVGEAGLMVLDTDRYKPEYDQAKTEEALGKLPATKLRSSTPRGGSHDFYALAEGEVVAPSAGKVAPHVDVRSFHSYVLLPPSKTADGEYKWEEEGKPAFRTDDMVRAANTVRTKSKDRDNWLIEPDLPENVANAAHWLKTDAKIAVEGVNGDHMAYATAAHMKSFGISQTMAFDLMWEHWNPRCKPAWSADDIEHLERKVENGYTYNTSPPGNITEAYRLAKGKALFQPRKQEAADGIEVTAGRFRFVDRAGMGSIVPPEWLIHGFLPEQGFSILVGAPGTFKTFVALDIALSVASGASFPWEGMWGEVSKPGPVLLAVGEGRGRITDRIRAWEKTHWGGKEVNGIVLADPVPLVSEQIDPFIAGALALNPDGYKLVVIDTVGRSMQGMNENAQENASQFTALVERVQKELGAAVLALHHTGHGQEKRARGSSVFGADADTVLFLDRQDKSYVVELSMLKQKDAEEWDRPRYVRLDEIYLSPKVKSLVAMPAKESERPKKSKSDLNESPAVAEIICEVVEEILGENRLATLTNRALSRIVASDPRVSLGSEAVRKTYLKALSEDSASPIWKHHNARKDTWRYRS